MSYKSTARPFEAIKTIIIAITDALIHLGYTWDEIEVFWKECIAEAQGRNP